jgi:glucose-6-phosphate 1-dehydrogenase
MANKVVRAEQMTPAAGPTRAPTRVDDPFALVIFGARGNLAGIKLFPALYRLWTGGFFAAPWIIVGVGRVRESDEHFRRELWDKLKDKLPADAGKRWPEFAASLFYQPGDVTQLESFGPLAKRLGALEKEHGLPGNRLFYLAVDPEYFPATVENLAKTDLARRGDGPPWTRIIIEKPFGKDLASARALDDEILRHIRESQVFRIDHYLGKETVQNLFSVRFGNTIFEPVFNRRYVDHVEITMAESIGLEGRADYYDDTGALRDVVQNHVLQLLALVAMEPPGGFAAKEMRDEKVKVLRNLTPLPCAGRWHVRGQYGPGTIDGKPVPGYLQEKDVEPDSVTETFAALRVQVDTWRWAGVPFLLRAGKRLPKRLTEIAVQFKLPPLRLFNTVHCIGDDCHVAEADPNLLLFRIQPDEGVGLTFLAKRPGMHLDLQPVRMLFEYDKTFTQPLPEAYERLLLDALRGDGTLFTRSDEVLAAWQFLTPVLEEWKKQPPPAFPNYAAGTWGPAEADILTKGCQCTWRQP